MTAPRRIRGFTLVEVMATVAILGILMSIMIYGLGQYRRRAFEEKTKAHLQQIEAALAKYYATFRRYPPDGLESAVKRQTGGRTVDIRESQCLVYYLGFPVLQEVEVGQDTRLVEVGPFLELSGDLLKSPDTDANDLDERLRDPLAYLADGYGNAFHYDNLERDAQGQIQANEPKGLKPGEQDQHLEDGAMIRPPDPRRASGMPAGGSTGGSAGATGGFGRNKGSFDLWSHGSKIADPKDDVTNWK